MAYQATSEVQFDASCVERCYFCFKSGIIVCSDNQCNFCDNSMNENSLLIGELVKTYTDLGDFKIRKEIVVYYHLRCIPESCGRSRSKTDPFAKNECNVVCCEMCCETPGANTESRLRSNTF